MEINKKVTQWLIEIKVKESLESYRHMTKPTDMIRKSEAGEKGVYYGKRNSFVVKRVLSL